MNTKQMVKEVTKEITQREITEMADAHCHLDLITDNDLIKSAIAYGVRTIITNGVDTKSNMRSLEIADNKHIFAMLGIDPEHSNISDEELNQNLQMIKHNHGRIVGIGEIGLDYGAIKEKVTIKQQRHVFEEMLNLAKDLNLPVSIHSREALDDVLQILTDKNIEMAHIHFFEGNEQQAKQAEKRGYMISVPPLQSSKRGKAIKEIGIDNIMAESDSPVVGASPKDVYKSIGVVSEIKKLDFKKTADLLTQNTKRYFRIHSKGAFMRF